jgi:hypothetical protein
MKVLICGSRTWTDETIIANRINELPEGTIIIEGGAKGADTLAKDYAIQRGLFVAEVCCTNTHWNLFGRRAGMKRNEIMLELEPDLVIAFQENNSRGTQGTINQAKKRNIKVEIHSL